MVSQVAVGFCGETSWRFFKSTGGLTGVSNSLFCEEHVSVASSTPPPVCGRRGVLVSDVIFISLNAFLNSSEHGFAKDLLGVALTKNTASDPSFLYLLVFFNLHENKSHTYRLSKCLHFQ